MEDILMSQRAMVPYSNILDLPLHFAEIFHKQYVHNTVLTDSPEESVHNLSVSWTRSFH